MADRGGQAKYPELESMLIAFIKEKQHRGVPISFHVIRSQAKELTQRLQLTSFCACAEWVCAVLRRLELKQ